MTKKTEEMTIQHSEGNATLKSYVTGFILSLILTFVPYFLVVNHLLRSNVLLAAILGIAMTQLVVQLVFFLHMGDEQKPRWNLAVLISFLSIVFVVVIASLWIMTHLNYNMSLMQFNNLMQYGEGF